MIDGIQRCLFCHSTNPRAVLDRSGPESSDRGIGCERCHGPGALHQIAVEAKFRDRAIINPKLATAEGRLRLCGQCHAYHRESSLPRTDSFWIRFQGTTLPWSRCYTRELGCPRLHDLPRPAPEVRVQGRGLYCQMSDMPLGRFRIPGAEAGFDRAISRESTHCGLSGESHARMRRLSHAAIPERAHPRHFYRSLYPCAYRAEGSEPQVNLVLLEIPYEQVRDSEEDSQSRQSVPERCRGVAGDDGENGPLDRMVDDIGSQRVLTERAKHPDLERANVAHASRRERRRPGRTPTRRE